MPAFIGGIIRSNTAPKVDWNHLQSILGPSGIWDADNFFQDDHLWCGSWYGKRPADYSRQTSIDNIWFEGDLVIPPNEFHKRLAEQGSRSGLRSFLSSLNGAFSFVWYDKAKSQIHFITDRLGFRPLYLNYDDGNIRWTNQLRNFLGLSDFENAIEEKAVLAFLKLGYLPG